MFRCDTVCGTVCGTVWGTVCGTVWGIVCGTCGTMCGAGYSPAWLRNAEEAYVRCT